jgi:hypothetical protein
MYKTRKRTVFTTASWQRICRSQLVQAHQRADVERQSTNSQPRQGFQEERGRKEGRKEAFFFFFFFKLKPGADTED